MPLTVFSSLTLKQKAAAHLLATATSTTTKIKFSTQMPMLLSTKLLIKMPIMLLEALTMLKVLIKLLNVLLILLLNLLLTLELELELELPLTPTEIVCLRLVLLKIFQSLKLKKEPLVDLLTKRRKDDLSLLKVC